jgi:steroid delta-isomerase-like uncharacterized protein
LNKIRTVGRVRVIGTLESNKRIVTRYYEELLNEGRLDVVDELFSEEFLRDDEQVPGRLKGRAAVQRTVRAFREGFSDFHEDVEDLFATDDRVAARFRFTGTHDGTFLNVRPTGRSVSMNGIEIFQLQDGRITNVWYGEPLHELLEQLGAIRPVDSGW